MSETNGYATIDEIQRDHTGIRYKDVTVGGKKIQLHSLPTGRLVGLAAECAKSPRKQNQLMIIAVVEQPQFTKEQIELLTELDGAFVAQLAKECADHVGIEAMSVDATEDEIKN